MELLRVASFQAWVALGMGWVMYAALLLGVASATSPDMSHGQFSCSGPGGLGSAVRHGVLAVRGAVRSRLRCASACLKEEMCVRFAFNSTTRACTLEDATVVAVGGQAIMNDHSIYYERDPCTASFNTYNALSYNYPLSLFKDEFVLTFGVRASKDAIINWSTDGTPNNVKYYFVIGMAGNSDTAIRRFYNHAQLIQLSTPSVLSEDETRYFWLKYRRGEFWLGRSGQEAFLQYSDPRIPDVPSLPYVGFSSWYNSAAWQVEHWCP